MERIQPFLKWFESKKSLVKSLPTLFDRQINTYYEPFVGCGAFMFHCAFSSNIIYDTNPQLIEIYKTLNNEDKFNDLIALLLNFPFGGNKKDFALARKEYNRMKEFNTKKNAIFLYLNEFSNGSFRLNAKSVYIPSFAKKTNMRFPSDLVARLKKTRTFFLQKTIFPKLEDFRRIIYEMQKGDFVYFDPPSFNRIHHNFNENDQLDVIHLCDKLDKLGCFVLYTNAYSIKLVDHFLQLGKHWKIKLHNYHQRHKGKNGVVESKYVPKYIVVSNF